MSVGRILDGKAAATNIKDALKPRVAALTAAGKRPGLGTILVGDDPGSQTYVAGKHRDCAEVGIHSIRIELPANATEREVLAAVNDLNCAKECSGFIVQLPLPGPVSANRVLAAIDPDKDADGLHPLNLGKLVLNQTAPLPCTPTGIIELLRLNRIPLDGAEVVVVGRGLTVGRPLGLMLTRKSENATVTLTHTGTVDLLTHLRQADIVIAAVGRAHYLKARMIKPGAVVIDVGITRTREGISGDVDPSVVQVASALAPMPGGVGPMTRAILLRNVVEGAELSDVSA